MIRTLVALCLVVMGLMNSGMTAVVNLSSIGNSGGYGIIKRNDYGEWVKLGAQDFKEASENGVDGVFVPYQMSTKISSTGIQFSFPSNLLSSDSPINSQRNPWSPGLGSTRETDGPSLDSYFSPKGINWASNSLFATACAGITFDLNELKTGGNSFSNFSTYFGMSFNGDTWSSCSTAYAILVDGVLVSSGGGYNTANPFTGVIDISLNENSRFLTLAVLDDGNGNNYDHGVFVAPTLTTVPEPSSLSLLALGGVVVAFKKRRQT